MGAAVKLGLRSVRSFARGLQGIGKASSIRRSQNATALSGVRIRRFSDDLSSLFDQNIEKTKKPAAKSVAEDLPRKNIASESAKKPTSDDFDLLELQFSKAEPAVEAPGVTADLQSAELVVEVAELLPAFGSDEELIDYVATVVNETEWRQLYGKLAFLGDQVKAHHVPEIIKRAKNSPVVFSFYMWIRARRHVVLDPSVLNLLFEALRTTDKAEEMQWLLIQMHRNKIQLEDSIFVSVMLAYGRLKRTDDAAKIFLKMDELGCKPPKTSSFNCILRLLLDAGKNLQFDMLHSRMKMVRKMNSLTYELLLAKACRFGTADVAYKHYEEMKANGHEVSVAAYAALVECLSKAGREDVVFELLEQMKNPSEEVYNPLVKNLVEAGKLSVALTQYKKMLELRLKPSSSTCVPILAELVVTEKASQACGLFKEMVKSGFVSSRDAVDVVERAYGICKVGMVWSFVKDLPGLGCDFDAEAMHGLISGLVKRDRIDLARKLFRNFADDGKKLSVATYNLFIEKLLPDGAKQMFETMKQAGCEPDVQTYNGMMQSLIKENHLAEAYNIFVEMTDRDYQADLVTYKLLLQLLSRNERTSPDAVIEALTRLKDKGRFEGAGRYLEKLGVERLLPEKRGRTDGKVLVKILQKDGRKLDEVFM